MICSTWAQPCRISNFEGGSITPTYSTAILTINKKAVCTFYFLIIIPLSSIASFESPKPSSVQLVSTLYKNLLFERHYISIKFYFQSFFATSNFFYFWSKFKRFKRKLMQTKNELYFFVSLCSFFHIIFFFRSLSLIKILYWTIAWIKFKTSNSFKCSCNTSYKKRF